MTIQVLTQSREHIIEKTFDALKGCKKAMVHLYNSTSVAQREQVFRKSKEEIIDIAEMGAKLCKSETTGGWGFPLRVFSRELHRHRGGIRTGNL